MKYLLYISLLNILFSVDYNYSLESKYGDSDVVKFSEHILDVNTTFDNGLYINTQFEYSDPPLFGNSITGMNSGYLDYYSDNFQLIAGNIQALYGRGLSINTFQDHTIDFDNRINGIDFKYFLNDNFTLLATIGNGKFSYRQTPADQIANYSMKFDYIFINAIEYMNDKLGNFHILYLQNKISSLGSNFSDFEYLDYSSINSEYNIGWNKYFDLFEVYFEYSVMDYKINDIFKFSDNLNQDSLGHRIYFTLNTSLYDVGITYEYKDYLHPGYVAPFSSPPIGYRESTSILASRNAHSINFQDEIGHQVEINHSLNEYINFNANLSLAYRNSYDGNLMKSLI